MPLINQVASRKKSLGQQNVTLKLGLDHLEHIRTIDGRCLKIVIQHHENYDGTGYPYNISGNDIHLFGRIARIVDVYDAMTSNRSYAAAKRPFAALAEMKRKQCQIVLTGNC